MTRFYRILAGTFGALSAVFYCFLLMVPVVSGNTRILLWILYMVLPFVCFLLFTEAFRKEPLFFRLKKWQRYGIVCLLLCSLALSAVMESLILYYGKRHEISDRAEAIVILGAGLFGSTPSPTLKRRLHAGLALAERCPSLPVIVTGGQGPGEDCPEGDVMALYLEENGLDPARIVIENKSKTTRENFRFARSLVNWKNPEKPCAYVISNEFHMFRACWTGRDAGWDCIPWSASDEPYLWSINHFREQLGIVKHFIHPARYRQ